MNTISPQILAHDFVTISSILKNIVKIEGVTIDTTDLNVSGYPVLIGSRAAKWHVPFSREPNDWDLVATVLQSNLLLDNIKANADFKNIKLVHYSGVGLKIIGECIESRTDENSINFEIELASDKVNLREMKSNEFEKFNSDQEKTSAQMILELCYDVKDRTQFPLSNIPCIVAPLKVLEALKASHIYWHANFHKNIADLHLLRLKLLDYSQVPITQPLCSPLRDEPTELMLKTRIKETEIIRGIPAAHINLKKTNEEFLDRDDDLFVRRRVPHDELHECVKYGDRPIYEDLKKDKSKAWIEKSLFQQIDYQTQLNCVKEEAMVIALERYLIPTISGNQETSYRSALTRICTSLTKGWFRQFAIDNYPRLSNLDKDLLSIAHNIIDNHPLPPTNQEMPSTLLYKWILDPETRAIFEAIYPYTEIISDLELPKLEKWDFYTERYGVKITSPVNNNISITAIITSVNVIDMETCNTDAYWWASVAIFPSKDFEDLKSPPEEDFSMGQGRYIKYQYYDPLILYPFNHNVEDFEPINDNHLKHTSKHMFTIEIRARGSIGGSWEVKSWKSPSVCANSADDIASELEIPGFTGDLLFKYVLAYLQPTLLHNGSVPLKHQIDELKAEGLIPIKPQQHLWYDVWNYILKNGGGTQKLKIDDH